MSILTVLSAISTIKNLLPSSETSGKLINVVEKFVDGKATKQELEIEERNHELTAEVQLALAQIKLNTNEAQHPSIFVAGWRPAVGWICAVILLFNFIIGPILGAFGSIVPLLDASTMMPVLLGMLGIGGMRSFEKMKGVHRDNLDQY